MKPTSIYVYLIKKNVNFLIMTSIIYKWKPDNINLKKMHLLKHLMQED